MIDLWTLARAPEWRYELLNSLDQPQGALLGVRGGGLVVATFARLGGNASLELTPHAEQPIDFMNDRVLISYDPGVEGLEPLPLGVFLFSTPEELNYVVKRYSISMLSKMVVVDEDAFAESYSAPAGTNIVDEVVRIIRTSGETHIAATPSPATLSNSLVFEAGVSKLTIINELLTSAGYSALWCDGSGQFRVQPYLNPGNRPVTRVFEAADVSIVKPEWTRKQDLAGVPNFVIVVSPGSDEEPAIVGRAWNNDPASQFSIPRRNGRVITRREEVSDISSQAEADALAQRYLDGGMSPVAALTATHAIVPLEPGARVRIVDGQEMRDATVSRMTFDLSAFNSQCKAEWSEVTLG